MIEENEIKHLSKNINLEKHKQADCIMTNTFIFEDSFKKFYTCKQCEKTIGQKICEKCFFKCHRGHEQDSAPAEFHLNIREQHCDCAEKGHTEASKEQESETCCFNVIAVNLKIDQFVSLTSKEKKEKSVVCYGCFIGCNYNPEEYDVVYIKKQQFECKCSFCRTELKSGEANLNQLFFNFNKEKVVNLRKIFKNFMNAGKLKKDYEKEIIECLTVFKTGGSGLIEKFASVKNKLLLFKLGIKLNRNEDIGLIDKEQLIELTMKSPPQRRFGAGPPQGNTRNQAQDENVRLGFRGYYLYFVRNILIKPCLKNKCCWSQLSNLSNSTPFQRHLFREKFDAFYYRSKDNGFDLTPKKLISLIRMQRFMITSATESLPMFVIEYFKWCCVLASFDYRASEVIGKEEKKELNREILQGVNSLLTGLRKETVILNKDRGNQELNILKYIEKFFKTYLLRFNDERFFDYMQGIKDIDKVSFFFEKSKKPHVEGRMGLQNRLTAFQGLFFSKGEEQIVSQECYELLLSYEDSYIANLQTLVAMKDNQIDKVLYNYFIKQSFTSSRVTASALEKDQIYSDVMNCINNYSNTDMSPVLLYDDIKMALSLINEKLLPFTKIEKVKKKATEQLNKIRESSFSILFTIYKLFNTDLFIKEQLPPQNINYIQEEVLRLFRNFFDNPIIVPFFFTQGSMKAISNFYMVGFKKYHFFSKEQIEFYKEAILCSFKMNYPLDLQEFTQILVESDKMKLPKEIEEIFNKKEMTGEEKGGHEEEKALTEEEKGILEMISLKIEVMAKILQISSKESLMKVNRLIIGYLESIKYINLLKCIYLELGETQVKLYLNILRVVNSLNDYNYYFLPATFPIENLKDNLAELSLQLASPSLSDEKIQIDHQLRIFTKAMTRYYLISPFKVCSSSLERLIQKGNKDWSLKETINSRIFEEKRTDLGSSVMGLYTKTTTFGGAAGVGRLRELCDEFEAKIELLITNLARFKSHFYRIENNEDVFFNHFEEVILMPSIYIIYDIIAFFPSISSKAKYLVYKVISLFIQCYKFFLENIISYFLPEHMRQLNVSLKRSMSFACMMSVDKDRPAKIMQQLLGIFVIQRKNEDLKIFFQNIHDCLTNDLAAIEKDPLNLKMLFTKFIKFVSGLKRGQFLNKIRLSEGIFFDFHNKINTIEDVSEVIPPELVAYRKNLEAFVAKYLEKKADKENNVVIDFFEKHEENSEQIFKIIIKDLIGKLYLEQGEDVYNDRFFSVFDYFNKIFISNPSKFQEIILTKTKEEPQKEEAPATEGKESEDASEVKKSNTIINYVKSQLPLAYQITFIDYHKLSSHLEPKYKAIDIFVGLLEFLRLLCENHNQKFQMYLASECIKERKLLYFIVQIPFLSMSHFENYNNCKQLLEFFKLNSHEYFKPLITKVIDFNIELIQGSKAGKSLISDPDNVFNNCFAIYLNSALRALEDFENKANVFYLSEFFKFIVSLLEEYSTKEKYKKEIINYFNSNKIVSFLVYCTKQLYFSLPLYEQIPKDDTEYSRHLIERYKSHYDYFETSDYFTIASSSWKYLTIANSIKSCTKVHEIINEMTNQGKGSVYGDYNNWKAECLKFFEKIMKTVEVTAKFSEKDDEIEDDDENKDNLLQNIFLIDPSVLYLSKEDYKKFTDDAPYEDECIKLNHLVSYCMTLNNIIKIRTKSIERSALYEMLSKVDYYDAVKLSVMMSSLTAIFVLFSSYYLTNSNFVDGIITETNSIRVERNEDWIFYIGLAHLIFLFSVMFNWVFFEASLWTDTEEKTTAVNVITKKYFRDTKSVFVHQALLKVLIVNDLVKKFLAHTSTFLIIWSFFWGLLAVCFSSCHFGYSLQLFAIFGLFETMKTVVISVKMRYRQFLSAGLLIIIFSLFFAGIKFIWFCDDVSEECQEYLNCFLALLTNGIRAGNGLGFAMRTISEPSYFADFFIEWLFYFSVILILLNVINGIIVDTFQEQREKANDKSYARENICYICNTNRSYFERNGQDYNEHIAKEHSIINYFEYFLTLLKKDEQSLNSIDSSIRKQFLNSQTNYFPAKKDKESD